MKFKFLLSIVALSVLVLYSCTGQKKATSSTGASVPVLKLPCQGHRSDANFFRATGEATSPNLSMSKEKALTTTRARLAGLIETKVKSVGEQYMKEMQVDDAFETKSNFERMTREVTNQTLQDVTIICEETLKNDKGLFESYYALEVSKDAIYNGIKKGISNDKKLELRYDMEKFREKFDEEMRKLE